MVLGYSIDEIKTGGEARIEKKTQKLYIDICYLTVTT